MGVGSSHEVGASTAEVALVVDDVSQGHGLGTLLLEDLVARARARGLHELVALVLCRNVQMLQVFHDLGLPLRTERDGDTLSVTVDLAETPALEAALAAREAAAAARVDAAAAAAALGGRARFFRPPQRRRPAAAAAPAPVRLRLRGTVRAVNRFGPSQPLRAGTGGRPGAAMGPADLAVVAVAPGEEVAAARSCVDAGAGALAVLGTPPAARVRCGTGPPVPPLPRRSRRAAPPLPGRRHPGARARQPRPGQHRPGRPAWTWPCCAGTARAGAVGAGQRLGARHGEPCSRRCTREGSGVSTLVDTGLGADVGPCDLLAFAAADPRTAVAALCLHAVADLAALTRAGAGWRRCRCSCSPVPALDGDGGLGRGRGRPGHGGRRRARRVVPPHRCDPGRVPAGAGGHGRPPGRPAHAAGPARRGPRQRPRRGRARATPVQPESACCPPTSRSTRTRGCGCCCRQRPRSPGWSTPPRRRAPNSSGSPSGRWPRTRGSTPWWCCSSRGSTSAPRRSRPCWSRPRRTPDAPRSSRDSPLGAGRSARTVPFADGPEAAVTALAHVVAQPARGLPPASRQPAHLPRPAMHRLAGLVVAEAMQDRPTGGWLSRRDADEVLRAYGVEVVPTVGADGPETAADASRCCRSLSCSRRTAHARPWPARTPAGRGGGDPAAVAGGGALGRAGAARPAGRRTSTTSACSPSCTRARRWPCWAAGARGWGPVVGLVPAEETGRHPRDGTRAHGRPQDLPDARRPRWALAPVDGAEATALVRDGADGVRARGPGAVARRRARARSRPSSCACRCCCDVPRGRRGGAAARRPRRRPRAGGRRPGPSRAAAARDHPPLLRRLPG